MSSWLEVDSGGIANFKRARPQYNGTNLVVASDVVSSISATSPIVASASTGAVTLSHANSGVTAGTYNNVTVNATGHVTAGSNTSYLTSYTETDTLATVTARGASTSTASTFSGGLTVGRFSGQSYGLDTAASDVYASMRVIANTSYSGDGHMYIGYGNRASGVTRLFGEGYTSNEFIKYGTYSYEPGSFRAPIFYDSDNTGYYLNPNSTSNISVLNAGAKRFLTEVGNNTINSMNPLWSWMKQPGCKLYMDEQFDDGNNSISIYNNAGGSAVTHTRKNSSFADGHSQPPNASGYVIEIMHAPGTSSGTSPGYGGWYFATGTGSGKRFVCVFKMKIPTEIGRAHV